MIIKKPKTRISSDDDFVKELQTSNTIEAMFKSINKEENLEKIYQNLSKAVQLNTTLPSSIDKP